MANTAYCISDTMKQEKHDIHSVLYEEVIRLNNTELLENIRSKVDKSGNRMLSPDTMTIIDNFCSNKSTIIGTRKAIIDAIYNHEKYGDLSELEETSSREAKVKLFIINLTFLLRVAYGTEINYAIKLCDKDTVLASAENDEGYLCEYLTSNIILHSTNGETLYGYQNMPWLFSKIALKADKTVDDDKMPIFINKLTSLSENIIKTFGKDNQDMIFIEEMSELTKALLKLHRYPDSPKHMTDVVEEFSHVLITLVVNGKIMGITIDDIMQEIDKKNKKYGF